MRAPTSLLAAPCIFGRMRSMPRPQQQSHVILSEARKTGEAEASKYYELLDTFLAILVDRRQVVFVVSSALSAARPFDIIVGLNMCNDFYINPKISIAGARHIF